MRYEIILEKGDYALIVRKNNLDEYAVVHYLNKESGSWGATYSYWNFGDFGGDQSECLFKAIDCFRRLTEENYIPYSRMEELATDFAHEMAYAEPIETAYYLTMEKDLDEYELNHLGFDKNGYEKKEDL